MEWTCSVNFPFYGFWYRKLYSANRRRSCAPFIWAYLIVNFTLSIHQHFLFEHFVFYEKLIIAHAAQAYIWRLTKLIYFLIYKIVWWTWPISFLKKNAVVPTWIYINMCDFNFSQSSDRIVVCCTKAMLKIINKTIHNK